MYECTLEYHISSHVMKSWPLLSENINNDDGNDDVDDDAVSSKSRMFVNNKLVYTHIHIYTAFNLISRVFPLL